MRELSFSLPLSHSLLHLSFGLSPLFVSFSQPRIRSRSVLLFFLPLSFSRFLRVRCFVPFNSDRPFAKCESRSRERTREKGNREIVKEMREREGEREIAKRFWERNDSIIRSAVSSTKEIQFREVASISAFDLVSNTRTCIRHNCRGRDDEDVIYLA